MDVALWFERGGALLRDWVVSFWGVEIGWLRWDGGISEGVGRGCEGYDVIECP